MTRYSLEAVPDHPTGPESLAEPGDHCPDCDEHIADNYIKSDWYGTKSYTKRRDYWCPYCKAYVGSKFSYEGPEPTAAQQYR